MQLINSQHVQFIQVLSLQKQNGCFNPKYRVSYLSCSFKTKQCLAMQYDNRSPISDRRVNNHLS